MLGTLIRLFFILLSVMVILNIIAPIQAKKVISSVSDSAGFDKEVIQKGLDSVTTLTKEGFVKAGEFINKKIEENKQ